MSGYALGQGFGYGITEQSTVTPGVGGAAVVPAAGANYTLTLTRYDWWRLIGVSFTLVSDSNAANRFVQIQYPGGDGVLMLADQAGYAHVASKTVQYYGALDGLIVQDTATNVSASFRLSGLWLEAGRAVTIAVLGKQVGDQLSAIRLTFDRVPSRDPVLGGWSDPAAGQE